MHAKIFVSTLALVLSLSSCQPALEEPKANEISDALDQSTPKQTPETLTPKTALDTPATQDSVETPLDLTVTQNIRLALMENKDLGTKAKDIKVITVNGVVTLRGLVGSTEEKTLIINIAETIEGVKKVEDQIQVKD